MSELGAIAEKVRSKNAGPFWVTIDIFRGTPEAYARIRDGLATADAARALGVPTQELKRFDIPDLKVIKLSAPRPAIQGTVRDRDMHGAGWASWRSPDQVTDPAISAQAPTTKGDTSATVNYSLR